MKRLTLGLLALGLGLVLATGASAYTGTYTAGTGINNTPHDLGTAKNGMDYTALPADSLTRICIYCHAPHNTYKLSPANGGPGAGVGAGPQAPDAYDYLPLWNHQFTANLDYTMYQNGPGAPQSGPFAANSIVDTGMVVGSETLLCMSCHDGSVSVNAYGNTAQLTRSQSSGGGTIGVQYVIGKDQYLGNHHPVGFDYDAVQALDGDIRDADTAEFGAQAGFVRDHLYGSGVLGSVANMECGTCHSVHNKRNTGETLLWRSDVNSELCLTCHDKGLYTDPTPVVP